jgi:hypothetical protein
MGSGARLRATGGGAVWLAPKCPIDTVLDSTRLMLMKKPPNSSGRPALHAADGRCGPAADAGVRRAALSQRGPDQSATGGGATERTTSTGARGRLQQSHAGLWRRVHRGQAQDGRMACVPSCYPPRRGGGICVRHGERLANEVSARFRGLRRPWAPRGRTRGQAAVQNGLVVGASVARDARREHGSADRRQRRARHAGAHLRMASWSRRRGEAGLGALRGAVACVLLQPAEDLRGRGAPPRLRAGRRHVAAGRRAA